MKKTALLLFLCIQQTFGQIPKPQSGHIIRLEKFKSRYIEPRNIDIWIPDSYIDDNKQRYDVLYMHDGQMLFDSAITWNKQEWKVDETITRLISSGSIRKTIIIGIANGGKERHNEFTPQIPFETLPQTYRDSVVGYGKRNNGNDIFSGVITSDLYLKFIVEELKPYIDENFRTQKKRSHTFIAGSSMGGLISLYAICEYPDVFGGAACLSTHWPVLFNTQNNLFPQAINDYLFMKLPDPAKHKIYYDLGDKTLDSLYSPYQHMVDETMFKKGYNNNNWKTIYFPGDDHSEKSWANRLEIPLLFLLGK